jgi:hypothetical protein
LRAPLGTANYGLAAGWAIQLIWRLESLGLGQPLGDGLLRTQNDTVQIFAFSNIHLELLGDPTLRLQVTAPVTNLVATPNGNNVSLTWNGLETGTSFHVYRSTGGLDGSFGRLTTVPLTGTSYTDVNAPGGAKLYQVRALKLLTTGSGSFTNLSQGIFVSCN